MKTMAFSLRLGAAWTLGACLLLSQSVSEAGNVAWSAVKWSTYNSSSRFTVNYTSKNNADQILYVGGNNPTSQDAATVKGGVEKAFGLTTGTLSYASSCESSTKGCTLAKAGTTKTKPYTNTFTSTVAYDYLAIHYGNGEILIHFATPVAANTVFNIGISGKPPFGGLSNWRAYLGPNSAVPIPAALWMVGSALFGLIGISRRKPNLAA